MRIDLHIHSTASDGSLDPAAVVRAARAGRLDVIALTDHDTVDGVPPALAAALDAPTVIPGVEMSSTHGGVDLHILGYFVQPEHPKLEQYGQLALHRRAERMRGMIGRLADLGIRVDFRSVAEAAGAGPIGRPHLARALVDAGHVRTVSEAFDRFLADGGPAFLPTELHTPRDAIDLIHAAGGVAVWAHPPLSVLERELEHFVGWGLEGIECFRPQNTPRDVRRLTTAAARFGLVTTGGSDWHGRWNGPLGDFHVGRDQVEALMELGGV